MSEMGYLREGFEQLTSMAIKLSKDPIFNNGGANFHYVYDDDNKMKELYEIMSFKKKLDFFVHLLLGRVKESFFKMNDFNKNMCFAVLYT